jgi:hypothetical protein
LAQLGSSRFDFLATCLIHKVSVVSRVKNHTRNKTNPMSAEMLHHQYWQH